MVFGQRGILIGMAVLVVTLAGCGTNQSAGAPAPTSAAGPTAMAAMGAATAAPTAPAGMDHGAMQPTAVAGTAPYDAQFIDSMIMHHQGAIDMANQALKEAEKPEIKTLAENIVKAQQSEIAQMQDWRKAWYPDLAPTGGMNMAMGEMMIGTDANKPFDQRFIEAMISHHQGAIGMAEMALEQSEHEEIRTLAEAIIAAQNAEIEQMQGWLAEWYGVTL